MRMPGGTPGAAGPAGGRAGAGTGAGRRWDVLRLLRHMRRVRAGVDRELAAWTERARAIPDPELRRQALASLRTKRFHCEGGSVFALAGAAQAEDRLVRAIVSLQTISDYLDNLSDRSPAGGEIDLRRLHRAFTDAVTPDAAAPAGAYYAHHPHGDDGGYLDGLVACCRQALAGLPGYGPAAAPASRLAGWYTELQCLKHLEPSERAERLRAWAGALPAPGLRWYEAAAACGSTLGIFALMAAASRGLDAAGAEALLAAYFPWPCALHILLDYLIDLGEDRAGGDFNFVACYPSLGEARTRLLAIQAGARRAVAGLPDAGWHRLVVAGLPAFYLSDRKVAAQGLGSLARSLLRAAGPAAWAFRVALQLPGWRRSP
jgi:tetraprenyl-beta-curcumene synthase